MPFGRDNGNNEGIVRGSAAKKILAEMISPMYTKLYMTFEQDISRFLECSGWVTGLRSLEFLAAGEYNENFLVRAIDSNFLKPGFVD